MEHAASFVPASAEQRMYDNIDIANILNGSISRDEDVRAVLKRLGLGGDGSFFCVVLFAPADSWDGDPHSQALLTDERAACVESCMAAALPADRPVRTGIQNNFIVAVVRAAKEESSFPGVPVDELTLMAVAAASRGLKERCGVASRAFVSNYSPGLMGARASCTQVQELKYYMDLFEKKVPVSTYSSLNRDHHRSTEELVKAEEREGRLLAAIQVNDFEAAHKLINELMDEELVFGRLRLQEAPYRFNSLINNVLHILDRMWIMAGDGYFRRYNPSFRLLTGPQTISRVREEINSIFAEYAGYTQRHDLPDAESIPKWCVRLRSYIFDNYRDSDLNTAMATGFVGLNPAYAARVFQTHYGASILEYINRLRITEAKRLLGTGMRLIDVAKAAGFDNLPRMNRAFLRYEGTTPKENARQLPEK